MSSSQFGFMAHPNTEEPARFPTTKWSRIVRASDLNEPSSNESLASLCKAYWYPLYAYIRKRGYDPESAADTTQEFFTRILEKGILSAADPNRGRFRSFLCRVCSNFLANRRDMEHAEKRGSGQKLFEIDSMEAEKRYVQELSNDLTPEKIFDRSWALTLLERVLEKLRKQYDDAGKSEVFAALCGVLTGEDNDVSYVGIADYLGISEVTVRVSVHRLRRRYAELLRKEILSTLTGPTDIEDEINKLFEALRS